MTEPRRLLDDPSAPAELREALAAEVRRGAQYDAAPLAARVAEAVAAGAPLASGAVGASGWLVGPKVLVATALVSASLGAGGHAMYVTMTKEAPPPAAVSSTVAEPPRVEPPPVPLVEPPAVAAPAPAVPKARAPGALVDELRLYERGEAALAAGHLDVAVRELKRYLAEHPRGKLRAEAELSLVEALARDESCDEALAFIASRRRASPAAHVKAMETAAAACSSRAGSR